MNDREILATAMRWHTTHQLRLSASANLYKHKQAQRRSTGYFSSDCELSRNVTEAKRIELAALRALAKVCEKVRGNQQQVCDADVIDLPMKRIRFN
jgi:hypothetical protein